MTHNLWMNDDTDVETFAGKVTLGAPFNTGQDCTAATPVYVEQRKYNDMMVAHA